MKRYQLEDFEFNPAWLLCRVDAQFDDAKTVDVYFVIDLPSSMLLAHEIVVDVISKQQVKEIINMAGEKFELPKRIILASGDPAEEHLSKICKKLGIAFETIPAPYLEELTTDIKQFCGEHFFSPSSIPHMIPDDVIEEYEDISKADLIASIPDSYSPCPCNSGKKYKFCCKPIFREITEAMVAAEEGDFPEALSWIEDARKIVGTTGELMCREAIVYSYFNQAKYAELLHECLKEFPNYPRAHYVHGIDLKSQNDLAGAIKAYKRAISLYPTSDQYHLNESYNNLGTVLYDSGDIEGAKAAWEKALFLMPSDRLVRQNLEGCIYNRI